MSDAPASDQPLRRTPLYAQHVALGAKMVPFAGYEMPVQYPLGILKEHLHTRAQAGLFDVSHMGQAFLIGPNHAVSAAALEALVPADILNLKPGQEGVQPIGLGARDSLRLEAGLCLYGHDIDETTSPVEADLVWSMQKRRRTEGGFPGAERIQDELVNGPTRRRVGIRPDGRAPAREGTEVLALLGDRLGVVTSGGFGPSVNGPIA